MATEIGMEIDNLTDSLLGRQLAEDACSFEFFQAVSLLQRLRADAQHVGGFHSPEDEAVHFRVNHRLGFPASEIQSLELDGNSRPEMTVNFMGLTGPMGVLPYAYSELILEQVAGQGQQLGGVPGYLQSPRDLAVLPGLAAFEFPGDL